MSGRLPEIFFCDLDGTLLDDDGSLHPDSRQAFLELSSRGTRVVLASGRIPVEMVATCEALGLDGPQITMNGALLASPVTGETLAEWSLDETAVHEHLEFAREREVPAVLAYRAGYATDNIGPSMRAAFRARLPEEVPDVDELARSRPLKTYLMAGPDRYRELLEDARRIFAGRYHVTSGGNNVSVELLDLRANKGNAAQVLAGHLEVEMTRVAAAGDGPNDVELLRACPVSIAMHEAPDFVRDVAAHVAPPRSQGGLAAAVERLFPSDDPTPVK